MVKRKRSGRGKTKTESVQTLRLLWSHHAVEHLHAFVDYTKKLPKDQRPSDIEDAAAQYLNKTCGTSGFDSGRVKAKLDWLWHNYGPDTAAEEDISLLYQHGSAVLSWAKAEQPERIRRFATAIEHQKLAELVHSPRKTRSVSRVVECNSTSPAPVRVRKRYRRTRKMWNSKQGVADHADLCSSQLGSAKLGADDSPETGCSVDPSSLPQCLDTPTRRVAKKPKLEDDAGMPDAAPNPRCRAELAESANELHKAPDSSHECDFGSCEGARPGSEGFEIVVSQKNRMQTDSLSVHPAATGKYSSTGEVAHSETLDQVCASCEELGRTLHLRNEQLTYARHEVRHVRTDAATQMDIWRARLHMVEQDYMALKERNNILSKRIGTSLRGHPPSNFEEALEYERRISALTGEVDRLRKHVRLSVSQTSSCVAEGSLGLDVAQRMSVVSLRLKEIFQDVKGESLCIPADESEHSDVHGLLARLLGMDMTAPDLLARARLLWIEVPRTVLLRALAGAALREWVFDATLRELLFDRFEGESTRSLTTRYTRVLDVLRTIGRTPSLLHSRL
jgi:hypothetical protein